MNEYEVTVTHDGGITVLCVTTDTISGAVRIIMAAEGCPEQAIVAVRRVMGSKQ